MNKGELVSAIALRVDGLNQKQAGQALDALIDVVMQAIASGEKVTLVGFGSWELRDRKSRIGRNPKTGEEMTIPAAKVPGFTPGKTFKERVNDGGS
ncbi:MAG: HU family DNA-binding protein [Leptolyngbyaceae cyanobacterium SL_5_14]|nr:HU family DNA-binding protein [Leptolyngbyaceae cyanobacterium SL_5_14]